jgi:hypothetical protein
VSGTLLRLAAIVASRWDEALPAQRQETRLAAARETTDPVGRTAAEECASRGRCPPDQR